MRILIVKTSSMGDVVHALPAASDIARRYPGAEIDWLVERPFAALPQLHPAVREVIPIQFRKWRKSPFDAAVRQAAGEAIARLRRAPYDLILDLQGLVKSAMFCKLARGPHKATPIAGYDRASIREPLASFLYDRTAAVARDQQAVARNRLLAAAHLGTDAAAPADFGLKAVKPLDAAAHDWLPATPYAVLMPAASRVEKLWPEAGWQAVGERLAHAGLARVVLWGSRDELERAQRIAQAIGGSVPPFLSVQEAAQLMAGASAVVGLDTGFTHLAAALGKPTIGIYCDHEPGLAGVTGPAFTASLGGKGRPPAAAEVLGALDQALDAAAAPSPGAQP
ncbi:MAG TPA: lipopolysaccharide heptosyltransferase I [Burkholderiaceae bacterium]|nr:lipopolysaccharide heptosyltransferase I [Burkholderiaceae bacterium]